MILVCYKRVFTNDHIQENKDRYHTGVNDKIDNILHVGLLLNALQRLNTATNNFYKLIQGHGLRWDDKHNSYRY